MNSQLFIKEIAPGSQTRKEGSMKKNRTVQDLVRHPTMAGFGQRTKRQGRIMRYVPTCCGADAYTRILEIKVAGVIHRVRLYRCAICGRSAQTCSTL